ncbi:TetR/AcrR family transcriptional regulator [Campylobacter helveticus]|uniref:TetR/AcrR family transcriptional regulator n=1 Tax=Campylobacter helveticus TaxID=28898 RepID=UPI00105230A5|nr:TetR/AcrR family transcriptional regulator [Campylobacter helveticus]QBL11198.1 TetR/AcrR family transcriptional regulator [Campylobacter helveticus]
MNKKSKEPSAKVLARQEKIKSVALELFLTKGYAKTSLSDIIKISGGSYSNIYTAYKNKEGLFFEILDDVCKRHFELLNSKIKESKSKKLEEILYHFGLTYVAIFNQVQTITFGKIIYSQVYNEDEHLGEWIKKNERNFAHNILVSCFKNQKGNYFNENAEKLATLFCAMLKEPHYILSILIDTKPMAKKEQEKHVKFVVELFLNGVSGIKR